MKNRLFVKILALSVIFLFTGVSFSSAISVDTPSIKVDSENDCYVDPNLHLNRGHLPILKMSLNYYRQSTKRELVIEKLIEQIIDNIDKNGIVRSKDIKNILINSNLSTVDIYSSSSIIGSAYRGQAYTIPLFILSAMGWIFGFGGFLWWSAEPGNYYETKIEIYVNQNLYIYPHDGLAFGFFGSGYTSKSPPNEHRIHSLWGYAILVIIIK